MELKTLSQKNRILVLIIALSCFMVYYCSLASGYLALDDLDLVKSISAAPFSIKGLIFPTGINDYYRPATIASFAGDSILFGLNPSVFHFVNIIIHLSNSILVFFLVFSLMHSNAKKSEIAFFSSLIFAIHPLNTEAVVWISARTDLLATFFSLITLWLLVNQQRNVSIFLSWIFLFLFSLLALMSKESAISLAPLALFWFLVQGRKLQLKNAGYKLLSVFLATAAYMYLRSGFNPIADGGVRKIMSGSVSVFDTVIKDLAASGFYLRKMLYPFPLDIAITDISVPINLVVCFVLLPVSIYLILRKPELHIPMAVVLTGLIPPILALNGNLAWTPYAERYTYLPMTGMAIVLGFGAARISPKISFPFVTAGILLLSVATFQRVYIWSKPLEFWSDAVKKSPEFSPLRLLYAAELLNANNNSEAATQLEAAMKLGLNKQKYVDFHKQMIGIVKSRNEKASSNKHSKEAGDII